MMIFIIRLLLEGWMMVCSTTQFSIADTDRCETIKRNQRFAFGTQRARTETKWKSSFAEAILIPFLLAPYSHIGALAIQ